jgi:ABC-2 type transport system ATP-binding protein
VELIEESHTDRQSTLVVRSTAPIDDPLLTVEQLTLEDLVLAYMAAAVASPPAAVEAVR